MGVAIVTAIALSSPTAEAQEWFARFDFHLDGEYAASGDSRFNWLFDFGGDLDVLKSGDVRAVFQANYEAIAGEEFRRFDVNQGNYLLEGALLFRVGGMEVGPVWHHVSRHLSDRPKRFPIDWNMIAVRAQGDTTVGRIAASWRADARATVTNAFVDYRWELEPAVVLSRPVSPRFSVGASGSWRLVGVDGTRQRGTQSEVRMETGVRMQGQAAAAELFVGAERRLDPHPLEFGTSSWFLAGVRVSTR